MSWNDDEELPPMPGEKRRGVFITSEQNIMVEVQGQTFEMSAVDALSMAGVILATVETYFRSSK